MTFLKSLPIFLMGLLCLAMQVASAQTSKGTSSPIGVFDSGTGGLGPDCFGGDADPGCLQ